MSVLVPKIIDLNVEVSDAQAKALYTAGVRTVVGYLNPLGQTSKALTPARVRTLSSAGLRVGLVSEGWGDFAHNGNSANAGVRDARHARGMVPSLGVLDVSHVVVYFAVDTDATWGQIISLVIPYFSAINQEFGLFGLKVGVYGSGAVCETLSQQQLVTHTWLAQSMGWLRSREYALERKWNMKQLLPARVCGVPCDPNLAGDSADIGDYVPQWVTA